MGCPAKKVTGGYSGSALMRDPDHALSLIEATVRRRRRAGDAEDAARLGRELHQRAGDRQRAEEAGVQMITIHGRTRMQFYNGSADWDAIRAVREVISVPLVANGDVETRGRCRAKFCAAPVPMP